MDQEVAEFLRIKCREISMKANNVPTNSQEFDALIDAAASIQDVLENHGEWKASPSHLTTETTGFRPK